MLPANLGAKGEIKIKLWKFGSQNPVSLSFAGRGVAELFCVPIVVGFKQIYTCVKT